ncbi:MAG: amidase [Wenzhouxiangellaceae bacterium]
MTRKRFFRQSPALAAIAFFSLSNPIQAEQPASTEWLELELAEARRALAEERLSSHQLTAYYLDRIARLDHAGPQLRSIIEINPDAPADAARLDRERRQQQLRSPLHGLTVVIKANIATADRTATSAGSLALNGYHAPADAQLVAQLRAAGLVILGKANLSEWANFRSPDSASGWSSAGGQTRNPYVLNRTPCGSSSGSAVAVSANLSLFAVGTETDGSILCPAAMNGVVGIKPSHGSISGDGIIPIASSQDSAGPMARRVADAAALLQLMLTPAAAERLGNNLYERAEAGSLKGARIGLVTQYADDYPEIQEIVTTAGAAMQAAGAVVVPLAQWQLAENTRDDEFQVLVYEFKRDLNQWLHDFEQPAGLADITAIIAYNRQHRQQVMPFFGQEFFHQAAAIDLQAREQAWRDARRRSQQAAAALIDGHLKQHQLDAILLPSYSLPWLIDHIDGDRFGFGTSSPAAIAGYPAITLPGGLVRELPVGLSLVGGHWRDASLIALAAALERQLQARQPPRFIPSLEQTSATAQ